LTDQRKPPKEVGSIISLLEQKTGCRILYLTEFSTVGDFLDGVDNRLLTELNNKLGFSVSATDRIYDIAKRVRSAGG
jgi:hypothetical protein